MLISMVGSLQGVCVWLQWPLRPPKEPWKVEGEVEGGSQQAAGWTSTKWQPWVGPQPLASVCSPLPQGRRADPGSRLNGPCAGLTKLGASWLLLN